MLRVSPAIVCLMVAALVAPPGAAQEREDRTLLSHAQMRAIIQEASGERAMHTVLELVPYPRVRSRAEFEGRFRESEVMARLAVEYGFSGVEIESFPSPGRIWHASQAELWMTAPQERKLYDVHEVAISIASNSDSGDISGELVDVGNGARADDYAGRDVRGKFVVGSGALGAMQRLAVFDRGAAGVLSYNSLRPDSFPDQILSQSLSAAPEGRKAGMGWSIAPRVGRELAARLGRAERVSLRSVVKAETFPGELEVVHAMIPGDRSSTQEVMISAHLYEGYQKQGANDDSSGCALTLEVGRAYLRLIQEGKLPAPKRNIRFLWVPEISGTLAWLRKHEDIKNRLIADLNFDMEGLGLRLSGATWVLHRTPDSFPSFLNDLCASVMEFVANTNRERVRYRHNGYSFALPVVSPNGSQDPFHISIEKYYGASDHAIYLAQGIPAVIFNTWPDMYYHSSHDTPDKLDPTQFKRAAVVAVAAMAVLAAADNPLAARVSAESLARGTERMGQSQRKGLAYLADAAAGEAIPGAFREAANAVSHQAEIEKAVIRSSGVLFGKPEEAQTALAPFEKLIANRAEALRAEMRAFYQMRALELGVAAEDPLPGDLEREAARLTPERVGPQTGGFGGGALAQAMQRLSPEERAAVQAAMNKVPTHMGGELNTLVGQNPAKQRTVLALRDFISGEFEPIPIADLMEYFRAAEKIGLVKFTELPEAKPAKKARPKKAPQKRARRR